MQNIIDVKTKSHRMSSYYNNWWNLADQYSRYYMKSSQSPRTRGIGYKAAIHSEFAELGTKQPVAHNSRNWIQSSQ
jgi:hypothetical protein